MSTQRQQVTIRDLVEEAKKRIVILVICVVGLSYLICCIQYKPSSANSLSQKKPLEWPRPVGKSEWKKKVNSPVVEDAIDHFTRHLVSERMTDLWYSRLTPDKEGPEELVCILNGVLGEISARVRNINLIHLDQAVLLWPRFPNS
ncbi:hypothetical protein FNV43_RR06840 [Rhamnella rubrinervis]|uniref:PXA domain-containing protein n=1 Tax=Rhamnella rubrinervis TaxID=2594499 RepID=A0A8K0HDQ5_9ROSA|nr:hypothetical protein FNV43_RR06840 [Rhamnella rubrinervis]